MKTKLTLLSILTFFCTTYYSQGAMTGKIADTASAKKKIEPEKQRKTSRQAKRSLVLGFKAGVNHSRVFDSQGESFVADPKWDYAAGMFVAVPFGGFSGLQPEILISRRGFRSSGSINNDPYSLDRTNTYMDVPVHLQLKPFRFFSVLFGLQYSRLLQQSDNFIYGANSIEQQRAFNSDDTRTNIGGTSFGFDVNINHIVISYRACRDLLANKDGGSSYTPRYKNRWTQVTVGYRLY